MEQLSRRLHQLSLWPTGQRDALACEQPRKASRCAEDFGGVSRSARWGARTRGSGNAGRRAASRAGRGSGIVPLASPTDRAALFAMVSMSPCDCRPPRGPRRPNRMSDARLPPSLRCPDCGGGSRRGGVALTLPRSRRRRFRSALELLVRRLAIDGFLVDARERRVRDEPRSLRRPRAGRAGCRAARSAHAR